jgi:hypothetical protein
MLLLVADVMVEAKDADAVLVNSCAIITSTELTLMQRIRSHVQEGRRSASRKHPISWPGLFHKRSELRPIANIYEQAFATITAP